MKRPLRPETFLPLKPHWFHVLLSPADQEQHGYGIMQEVLDRTGGKVRLWPATLYGTLKRLIDEELIEVNQADRNALLFCRQRQREGSVSGRWEPQCLRV